LTKAVITHRNLIDGMVDSGRSASGELIRKSAFVWWLGVAEERTRYAGPAAFRVGLGEKRPFPDFGFSAAPDPSRPLSLSLPAGNGPLPHLEACSRTAHSTTAQHRRRWSRRFDMEDREIRAALDRHWAASDANDLEGEHQIYREDAVLEYPQSGERIRGRRKIQSSRAAQPNRKRFTVRRMIGAGDLWVTEYVLTYDGRPSYTVSIMEFLDGKVARETQYFGDPFEPGPSRAQWVERMP
jgi:hypothetical protein